MFRVARVGVTAALAVAAGAAFTSASPAPAAAAATVPGAFSDVAVAAVSSPAAVTPLDAHRVVVLEKGGKVRLIRDGSLLANPALALDLGGCTSSEMGLLGFTPAADFAASGTVFLFASVPNPNDPGHCLNRVSRYTMSGDVIDPASQVVLLDLPGTSAVDSSANHDGGDLAIGKDGYLYVSIGDSGSNPRGTGGSAAPDKGVLAGKILRITTSGGIPPGNPFTGPGSASCAHDALDGRIDNPPGTPCQEIFAYGLRNPWRFAFDPNAPGTRLFINDVGQSTREEVDEGIAGANYGWPEREGVCAQGSNPPCAPPSPASGYTDPLTDYPRSVGQYITGGAFVPNGAWSPEYDGAYLFADGGSGKIFVRSAAGNVDYGRPFATGLGQIVDMAFVAEGGGYALYYVQGSANVVRKIVFDGGPPAPTIGNLRLLPIAPKRVYDTRNAIGTVAGIVSAGSARVIDVQRPDASVRAVLANVTLTQTRGPGFAQAWPTRTAVPETSVINASGAGETVANSVVLPVADDGTIVVRTSVDTELIVDVLGYFTAADGPGGEYRSLPPRRLVDTRQPNGDDSAFGSGSGNPYGVVGDHLTVEVAGRLGVPEYGAAGAVALIVTAIGDTSGRAGYVTAYPLDTDRPEASNVNTSGAGDIRANLVVVPLGPGGRISLYGFAVDDVIVDLAGWFTSSGTLPTGTGRLTVSGSQRAADTRQAPPVGFPGLGARGSAVLGVSPWVPPQATAVVHNLTIPSSRGWGFVTAVPAGAALPPVSNLNVTGPGQTRAALAITDVGPSAALRFETYAATDLIVDIFGYFT